MEQNSEEMAGAAVGVCVNVIVTVSESSFLAGNFKLKRSFPQRREEISAGEPPYLYLLTSY